MDKNIFTIRENDLSYGRGYVYSLQYHLVWCTKYRKKVLQNGLDEECKKRKSSTAAFSFSSGIKTGVVGRTFVESVILCSNSQ